ncbi:MAG: hypothetical protein QE271_03595 [Bacteriovoracaceae bacterium]|nr:hypothetical protein [Bacteriovoracaceae bacterium]
MKLLMRYFSLPVYFVFLMSIFSAQSSLACCSFEEILDLSQGDLFGIASQDYRQTENSKKLYIDFYVNEKISYLDMLRKVLLANFLLSRDEGIKKINLNSVLRMLGKWEIIGGNDITEIGNFKLFVDHTLRNYSAENLREYSKNIVETDFFNFAKVQFRLYLRGAENFSSDLLSFINQNPSRKVQLFWIAFSAIDSARSYLSFEEVSLLDEMRSSFLLRNLPDGNSEINADVVGKMQKSQLRGFTKNDFQRYSYSLGQTWEESIRVDVSAPSQVERVINQPVNQVSPSISEARPSITEPRNQPQPPINNPQSRPNSAISSNEGASNGPIGLEPLTPEMINRNFKNGVQAPDGYSYLATYSREKKMGAKANYSQFVSSMFSLGETCVKRSPREWPEFLKNYDSVFYNSNYSLDTLNLGSDLESNQRTFSFILTVYAPRFKSPFA